MNITIEQKFSFIKDKNLILVLNTRYVNPSGSYAIFNDKDKVLVMRDTNEVIVLQDIPKKILKSLKGEKQIGVIETNDLDDITHNYKLNLFSSKEKFDKILTLIKKERQIETD